MLKPMIAACVALVPLAAAWADGGGRLNELPVTISPEQMGKLVVTTRGEIKEFRAPGTPVNPRAEGTSACANLITYAGQSFEGGGTYAAQAGMAQGEYLAATYILDANKFPIRLRAIEAVFVTVAPIQTVTVLDVAAYDGVPGSTPVLFETTDDVFLPKLRVGPGSTNNPAAFNYMVQIDPADPDQVIIQGEPVLVGGVQKRRFSVAYRINTHNNQGGINPCTTGPSTSQNAFPVTDNSSSVCGNYSQLSNSANNWLFGLNCGPSGCPANGGWSTFANLAADQNVAPFGCFQGCRPRGDWMIRATWEEVGCIVGGGACCFPNGSCGTASAQDCANQGGSFQGEGTDCNTTACSTPTCPTDYNRDGFHNLDDLGDFITDYYTVPTIPGGLQPLAPQYNTIWIGYGFPCPQAPDAPAPYPLDAYRAKGYRVGFSPDGSNPCPLAPNQPFPNLDNLGDFVTAYYQGC
jgi:hypothetical protein